MNQRAHVLNAAAVGAVAGAAWAYPADAVAVAVSACIVTVPVVLGALLPDADCSVGSHRKTLHNLPVLGVLVAFPLVVGNLAWAWLGVLVHYVGDALLSGRGLALLWPLTRREWFGRSLPYSETRAAVALLTAAEAAVLTAVLAGPLPV